MKKHQIASAKREGEFAKEYAIKYGCTVIEAVKDILNESPFTVEYAIHVSAAAGITHLNTVHWTNRLGTKCSGSMLQWAHEHASDIEEVNNYEHEQYDN